MTSGTTLRHERIWPLTRSGRLDLELGAWIAVYALLPFWFGVRVGAVATAFFTLWAIAWRRPYHLAPLPHRLAALAGLIAMWLFVFGVIWLVMSMFPAGSAD
jgi:hypothetical protein